MKLARFVQDRRLAKKIAPAFATFVKKRSLSFFLLPLCAAGFVTLQACAPLAMEAKIDFGDVYAPQLERHRLGSDGEVLVIFNEDVRLKEGDIRLPELSRLIGGPVLDPEQQSSEGGEGASYGKEHRLKIQGDLVPGKAYSMRLGVEDRAGNELQLLLPFYGPNDNPAHLLINEVLTKMSAKNRDAVEFYATKSGSLGGLSFVLGVGEHYDTRFIFPDVEVKKGDYIVLHCKPEGIPEEIDELYATDGSGGANALSGARDFWFREADGLPDSHAILSLLDSPLGSVMDAVFYSDKTDDEGKDYQSFGSRKALERARILYEEKAWRKNPSNGTDVRAEPSVEDAASSVGMTATRSLNRLWPEASGSQPQDSDTASDWYVTAQGKASLGGPNSPDIYKSP